MCKFCENENCNPLASLKMDFGIFGQHVLDISIEENHNGASSLAIDLSEDPDYKDGLNLFGDHIKINYCPICGREF